MANSVDPDQTAPSGSALFSCAILLETMAYEILGFTISDNSVSEQWRFWSGSLLFVYATRNIFMREDLYY